MLQASTTHLKQPTWFHQMKNHLLVLEMMVPKTHTPERNRNAQNICDWCQWGPDQVPARGQKGFPREAERFSVGEIKIEQTFFEENVGHGVIMR